MCLGLWGGMGGLEGGWDGSREGGKGREETWKKGERREVVGEGGKRRKGGKGAKGERVGYGEKEAYNTDPTDSEDHSLPIMRSRLDVKAVGAGTMVGAEMQGILGWGLQMFFVAYAGLVGWRLLTSMGRGR